jgi:phosphatidylethanolamine-binding protein (PEBP) family uncharacterized protein
MQSGLRLKATLALAAAMALAGCGGSSSGSTSQASTTPTPTATAASTSASSSSTSTTTTTATSSTATEKVPNVDLQLTSSVSLSPIPAHYTCDGADVSVPINWGRLPPNTVEVDLFLFNLAPVHGKLFDSWAVAGLKPRLRGVAAGRLPAGAIVGRNSYGQTNWRLCPPKGQTEHLAFLLYALPKPIHVAPGFNAEKLREKALHTAESAGLLGASYKRR